MSLELALERNTAAIERLIGILSNGTLPVADDQQNALPVAEAPSANSKKTKAKKEATPEISEAPETVTIIVETVEPAPAPEPEPPVKITYADAAAAVTQVVKLKGKEAAKAVLAGFGAANLKEVDEERFAEVIAAAEKALG